MQSIGSHILETLMDVIAHVHVASGLTVFQLRQVVRFLVNLSRSDRVWEQLSWILGFLYISFQYYSVPVIRVRSWSPLTGLAGPESISWAFSIRVLLSDLVLIRDY